MFRRRFLLVNSIFLVIALVLGSAPVALANPATMTVVVSGLNNPRGLNFGPEGFLYVAEAGSGGAGPCAMGPEGLRCYGASGAIARIDVNAQTMQRITTGLPSLAGDGGVAATGPHDISFQGRGGGYFTIGFGGEPSERVHQFGPVGASFAQEARVVASGNWSLVNDLGEFENTANPAVDQVDTNPYGILALPGKQIIADAGANALNQVKANGKVSNLAVFPARMVPAPPFLGLPPGTMIPMDAVPTSVAMGPDGSYYVGQLTGFPFPVDGANVYRVPAGGGTPEIFASGFTGIIDIAFAPDGSLLVLEIAKNGLLAAFTAGDWTGALIQVAPDGTQTEIASQGLFAPGGVAVGADGAYYVTNNSILSGAGEVLKIQP